MISIKFPKLEKALRKDKKNIKLIYEKGIVVMNDTAYVCTSSLILAVNLKEYFLAEHSVSEDDEIKEIDKILFYLRFKIFTKEYWEELTKFSDIGIYEGKIKIENPKYSKSLDYEYEEHSFLGFIRMIKELDSAEEKTDEGIAVKCSDIKSIMDAYTELKNDTIVFTSINSHFSKFTFEKRKYFYGFVLNNTSLKTDPMKYEIMKEDLYNLKQLESLYKAPAPK